RNDALVQLRAFPKTASLDGLLGGFHDDRDRLVVAARGQQVVREVDSGGAGDLAKGIGGARVKREPARRDQVAVDRFAREGVAEAIPMGFGLFLHELLLNEEVEPFLDAILAWPGDG